MVSFHSRFTCKSTLKQFSSKCYLSNKQKSICQDFVSQDYVSTVYIFVCFFFGSGIVKVFIPLPFSTMQNLLCTVASFSFLFIYLFFLFFSSFFVYAL